MHGAIAGHEGGGDVLLDGGHTDLHPTGDLALRQAIDTLQKQGRPGPGRQGVEDGVDLEEGLDDLGPHLLGRHLRLGQSGDGLEIGRLDGPSAVQVDDQAVGHDPQMPTRVGRSRDPPADQDPDKGVMGDICGVKGIGQSRAEPSTQPGVVVAVQIPDPVVGRGDGGHGGSR